MDAIHIYETVDYQIANMQMIPLSLITKAKEFIAKTIHTDMIAALHKDCQCKKYVSIFLKA